MPLIAVGSGLGMVRAVRMGTGACREGNEVITTFLIPRRNFDSIDRSHWSRWPRILNSCRLLRYFRLYMNILLPLKLTSCLGVSPLDLSTSQYPNVRLMRFCTVRHDLSEATVGRRLGDSRNTFSRAPISSTPSTSSSSVLSRLVS